MTTRLALSSILRPEVGHLLNAGQFVRLATRQRVDHRDDVSAAITLINDAIGQLVAARQTIQAAETAPSKEL